MFYREGRKLNQEENELSLHLNLTLRTPPLGRFLLAIQHQNSVIAMEFLGIEQKQ